MSIQRLASMLALLMFWAIAKWTNTFGRWHLLTYIVSLVWMRARALEKYLYFLRGTVGFSVTSLNLSCITPHPHLVRHSPIHLKIHNFIQLNLGHLISHSHPRTHMSPIISPFLGSLIRVNILFSRDAIKMLFFDTWYWRDKAALVGYTVPVPCLVHNIRLLCQIPPPICLIIDPQFRPMHSGYPLYLLIYLICYM